MTNEMHQQKLDPVIVQRLIESTRSFLESRGLNRFDAVDAVAQLFAWASLSLNNSIDAEFSIFKYAEDIHNPSLDNVERLLVRSDNPLWSTAFESLERRFSMIGPSNLREVVYRFRDVLANCSVNWPMVAQSFFDNDFSSAIPQAPGELADLASKLLAIQQHETIYSAFHISFEIALKLAENGNQVYFEGQPRSTLIACLVLMSRSQMIVNFADPITQPGFIENGRLKGFDIGIAATNFGAKRQLAGEDSFGRFGSKGFYSEITDVKHVLAHTKSRAILVVPNGVLFRTSAGDKEFKEQVVQDGWLKAVIALPEGLLPHTGIPVSLMIFDKGDKSKDVLFIDVTANYTEESRRASKGARNKLSETDEILQLFLNRTNTAKSKLVSHAECEKQGYDLMVNRYVLSAEQSKIQNLLASSETTTLGDLAEIIRGQAVKPGSDDIQFCFAEVGAVDIGYDGLIREPQKSVLVDQKELFNKHNNITSFVLKPGDLVLAVKGSVGIVGLVPSIPEWPDGCRVPLVRVADMTQVDTVDEGGSGVDLGIKLPTNWIVGQSYVIVRPHSNKNGGKTIKPEVLLMYLKSEIAQNWIKSKAGGSTVPLLQKQYITGLPVIVPTELEQETIAVKHRELVKIEQEVQRLREQAESILSEPWPIS